MKMAGVIRFALLTAGAIILFRVIGLFVIYRYLRLDYYLSLVAVGCLLTGMFLNRRPAAPAPVPTPSGEDLLTLLTSKEVLVLRLLAEGKTNKEIAALQFIEVSTVKSHVNNIYTKLSVSNRSEARSRYAELTKRFPIL